MVRDRTMDVVWVAHRMSVSISLRGESVPVAPEGIIGFSVQTNQSVVRMVMMVSSGVPDGIALRIVKYINSV